MPQTTTTAAASSSSSSSGARSYSPGADPTLPLLPNQVDCGQGVGLGPSSSHGYGTTDGYSPPNQASCSSSSSSTMTPAPRHKQTIVKPADQQAKPEHYNTEKLRRTNSDIGPNTDWPYDTFKKCAEAGLNWPAPQMSDRTSTTIALHAPIKPGTKLSIKVHDIGHSLTNTVKQEVSAAEICKSHAVNQCFNIPLGTVALTFSHQIYPPTDPVITSNASRRDFIIDANKRAKALNDAAIADHKDPTAPNWVFMETKGCTTLSAAFQGYFSGGPAGIEAGGFAGETITYRWLRPCPENVVDAAGDVLGQPFEIPINASAARKMQAGSEFEFRMRSNCYADVAAQIAAGYNLPLSAIIGAGVRVAASVDLVHEYNITVFALDGNGTIIVTIEQTDSQEFATKVRLMAGLIFADGGITNLVGGVITASAIKRIMVQHGFTTLEEFLTQFTSIQLFVGAKAKHTDQNTTSFKIPLTRLPSPLDPAFNSIFHANCGPIIAKTKEAGSGVTFSKVISSEATGEVNAGGTFFGAPLFDVAEQRGMKRRTLTKSNGRLTRYTTKTLASSSRVVFRENQKKTWSSVVVEDESKRVIPHLEFCYHSTHKSVDQHDVDRFNNFVTALRAARKGAAKTALGERSRWKKLLRSNAVVSDVDIFFTEKALERINAATKEQAKIAYLQMTSVIDQEFETIPFVAPPEEFPALKKGPFFDRDRQTADQYIREFRDSRGPCCGQRGCETDYNGAFSRTLKTDVKLIEEAEKFGDLVEELTDTNNALNIQDVVTAIHTCKLDWMRLVASLAYLAKAPKNDPDPIDETVVHVTKMTGRDVDIETVDEGFIQPPDAEINQALKLI